MRCKLQTSDYLVVASDSASLAIPFRAPHEFLSLKLLLDCSHMDLLSIVNLHPNWVSTRENDCDVHHSCLMRSPSMSTSMNSDWKSWRMILSRWC